MVIKQFSIGEIAQRHEDFNVKIAKTMDWLINKVEKLEQEVEELKIEKRN